jgi:hypothetical protein
MPMLSGHGVAVLNGSGVEDMITTFSLGPDGRLVGRYHIEDAVPFDGTLILVANSGGAGAANKSQAMTFVCNNDSRQSRLRVFSIFLASATGKHSRIAPRNSSV